MQLAEQLKMRRKRWLKRCASTSAAASLASSGQTRVRMSLLKSETLIWFKDKTVKGPSTGQWQVSTVDQAV